ILTDFMATSVPPRLAENPMAMLEKFGNVKAAPALRSSPRKRGPSFAGFPACAGMSGTDHRSIQESPVKAILCEKFGTPADLKLPDIPDPAPAPGEVVARVKAAGLNFFDTLIIAGKYQTKPAFPFSPAGEFAGIVGAVGPGVSDFAPGDRVFGYTNFNAA